MKAAEFKKLGDYVKIKTGKLDANASSDDGEYPFFTCSIEPLKISSFSYDCECCLVAGNGDLNVKYYNGKFDAYQRTYIIESLDKEKLDVMYLYFFLCSYIEVLRKQSIGGVIKYIKLGNLTDALIPIPSLEKQKKICRNLIKAQKVLNENQALFSKYDILIKSRFIEMFGNPQCISNNWKVNPLSDYCIVNPKKSELGPIPDDYELSFIPMQSVSENGDVDTSSIKHYKDVKTGFTYFRENDVLFAKITPCMENGKGGVARKLKNQIGFGSTEFHVLRPIETISNSEWIYRLTTFKTFRKDAENNMTGSAGQRRTPKEFFDKYKVGLPPIELQNDFAAFVQQIDKSKFENTTQEIAA